MSNTRALLIAFVVALPCACGSSDDGSGSTDDTGTAQGDSQIDAGHDGVATDSHVADSHAGDSTSTDSTSGDSTTSDSTSSDSTSTDSTAADSTIDDTSSPDTTVDDTAIADTTVDDTGVPVDVGVDTGIDGSVDAPLDAGDGNTDVSVDAGPPSCPGTKHVCICVGGAGFYCLPIGVGCLSPTSPCP